MLRGWSRWSAAAANVINPMGPRAAPMSAKSHRWTPMSTNCNASHTATVCTTKGTKRRGWPYWLTLTPWTDGVEPQLPLRCIGSSTSMPQPRALQAQALPSRWRSYRQAVGLNRRRDDARHATQHGSRACRWLAEDVATQQNDLSEPRTCARCRNRKRHDSDT